MKNSPKSLKSEKRIAVLIFIATAFSTYMLLKKVFFEGYAYGDPRIMFYSIPYTSVISSIPSLVYLIKNKTSA